MRTSASGSGQGQRQPGEWFLGFTAGGGWASGPERQAFQEISQAPPGQGFTDHGDVNFNDRTFFVLGVQAGYVLARPLSLLDRIELEADLRVLSRDITADPRGAAFVIVGEGFGSAVLSPFDDTQIDGNDDQSDVELRLSFKNTVADNENYVLVASIEPFVRFQDMDGRVAMTRLGITRTRKDEIAADYYGLQAALEIESPLSETMSLIGRASAGAYHVDADIDSRMRIFSDPVGRPVGDGDSAWGGRFGGALGIKVPLHYAGASLSLMGTLDYLTDVATIDHVGISEGEPVTVYGRTEAAFDDALDVGGRVELVFPLR